MNNTSKQLKNELSRWEMIDKRDGSFYLTGVVKFNQPEAGVKAGEVICTSSVKSMKREGPFLICETTNSRYILV